MIFLVSNVALVLLPIIGLVLSGVIERNSVHDLERSLRLMGTQWATYYKLETLALKNRDELLRDYPVFEQRDSKYNYGVFGIRPPQLDPRILPRILGLERFYDDPIYPKLSCEEIDGPSDDPAQWIGDRLQQLLDQRPSDDVSIRIVDHDGFVLAQNPESNKCGRLSVEYYPSFLKVLDGIDRASFHRNEKSEPPRWARLISHWGAQDVVIRYPVNMKNESTGKDHILALVVLSKTPISLFESARSGSNRAEIWSFFLILAVSLLVVTVFVTLSISRPVQAVRAQMRRAKKGERGAVVPLHRTITRDVKDLSRDIVSLVKILEQRENQTRDLAFHVAHQTRTPLTSTLVSIGLLRQHAEKMSDQDKEKFLSLIEKDARRLEIMTDRLMELAKSERMAVGENEQVIVEEVLRRLEKDTDLPRFSLHVKSSAKGQSVGMKAQWLESVITDLINNAHEHGGEDVDIAVTLDVAKQRERSLAIVVHNDGQGILPIDRERVFDPFFTTSKSRANSGLGLAIVKAVLAAHNATIELVDTSSGVTFEIVLPIR